MSEIKNIEPTNYKILLELDTNKETFEGSTEMEILLKTSTDKIIIHVDDLDIKQIQVKTSGDFFECEHEIEPEKKQMILSLKDSHQGKILIKADYEGKFHKDLLGMYRSSYEENGEKKHVIVTQFEEIFARRAFPCIDHPSKKTTFNIEFIIDEDLKAISNTPIKTTAEVEGGKKRVIFEKTPKMCTYLLFFGVGDFEVKELKTEKHHVRLMTTPGKTKYGNLGLEMASKSLEFLENYTSIDYPIKKCDVIAVPDFQFGAMENWGAILFRETLLLVYPDKTSKMGIFNVGSVVAHEVSHFWFGNLVSPSDWKYIWLNESFASYFTYAIPDEYYPEWHSWEHFITQYYISSLERDCLVNTFPVELLDDSEVFITPAKVGIIYNKGAAVLRMLVSYLGVDTFKKGIEFFMKKYQFDIANSQQYWEAFEEATNSPVKEFEDSWIHQPGYPVIKIQKSGNKISLTQSRFTLLDNESEEQWLIPIKIEFFKEDTASEIISVSFNSKSHQINLPPKTKAFKLNSGQTGFYRVKYDEESLTSLKPLIKSKKLSPIDRFGIENDLFALLKRGDYDVPFYLDYVGEQCLEEEDYLTITSLISNLLYIHTLKPELRPRIEHLGLSIVNNFLDEHDYEPKEDEPMTVSLLRNYLLWIGYSFGLEKAKKFGIQKFKELNSGGKVSSDLLSTIYRIAMLEDDSAKEVLLKKIDASETPQVELRYIYDAIGSVKEKAEVPEALKLTLEKIPPQTWFAVFYRLGHNKAALNILWPWFKENLSEIEKQNPFVLGRTIAAIVPMGGLAYKKEVEAFFADYMEKNEFQKDTIEMALEQMEINYQFHISNNIQF